MPVQLQINAPLQSILKKHETEKKRKYNERVMQVDSGSFTPLVFFTVGSMGPETVAYHKALAEKIAQKKDEWYSDIISYIRTMLSSLSVKSALLCLRGSRGKPGEKFKPQGRILESSTKISVSTMNDFVRSSMSQLWIQLKT